MKIIFFIAALVLNNILFAQRVRVGQKVSNLTLSNVSNSTDSVIQFDQLKGKLVILDFWSTTCGSCITAFPKLDKIQKEFDGQLQIIAVNSENEDYASQFLRRKRNLQLPNVPFVMGDTLLQKMFPRNYVPWHVWIDKDGVVQYITDGVNATADNIRSFLEGRPPVLEQLVYKYRL